MRPNFEVNFVPSHWAVLVSTQVPINTTRSKVRTRKAVLHRNVTWNHTNSSCARLEDLVAEQQRFDFITEVAQLLHHYFGFIYPSGRKIVLESTNAVEVWMETSTRCRLDEVQYVLAITERDEYRSNCTQLHTKVA